MTLKTAMDGYALGKICEELASEEDFSMSTTTWQGAGLGVFQIRVMSLSLWF